MIDKDLQILNPLRENPRPEWWYQVPMKKGGGTKKIFFSVTAAEIAGTTSPYNGKMILTVDIIVEPCDMDLETAEVVDWSTCLANEEDVVAVVGREGWAFLGRGRQSLAEAAATGEKTPCHWVLDGLCCP
jgi:hypothetical protein